MLKKTTILLKFPHGVHLNSRRGNDFDIETRQDLKITKRLIISRVLVLRAQYLLCLQQYFHQ